MELKDLTNEQLVQLVKHLRHTDNARTLASNELLMNIHQLIGSTRDGADSDLVSFEDFANAVIEALNNWSEKQNTISDMCTMEVDRIALGGAPEKSTSH